MSVLAFKSIFNMELGLKYKKSGDISLPASYTYVSSLISCLKKINVTSNTLTLLCLDDKSWRKNLCADYKANRKEAREKHTLIDWQTEFDAISKINSQLDYATPFHILRIPQCEADDIASVATRIFKDKEIILATIDVDWHMLAYYQNVKIFNLNFKTPKGKGGYVKVTNEEALNILEKKCRLGDKGDNVLVYPNEDENDAELRRVLVNLLELPEFVEKPITEVLTTLPHKTEIKWGELPFQNSLAKRFQEIYDPQFKIDYNYCVKLKEKRVIKKKKKEADKRQLKKMGKINDQL
jgi:5'-3' exonuclease